MEEFLVARFDVYINPSSRADITPYLLDVQSDLLDGLDTRTVIPLRALRHFPKVKLSTRLTPVFVINGEECLLETPKLGAIPTRLLKSPVVSLQAQHDQVLSALDFLFQGF
jgi:toxin CcdB